MSNELYRIIYDPGLKAARMELSPYFMRLSPDEGVAKLKSCIETLSKELRQRQQVFMDDDVDIPKSLEEIRRLVLELELCQQCIPYFLEHIHFRPLAPKDVEGLRPAA